MIELAIAFAAGAATCFAALYLSAIRRRRRPRAARGENSKTRVGETVAYDDLQITVLEATRRRVERVRSERQPRAQRDSA